MRLLLSLTLQTSSSVMETRANLFSPGHTGLRDTVLAMFAAAASMPASSKENHLVVSAESSPLPVASRTRPRSVSVSFRALPAVLPPASQQIKIRLHQAIVEVAPDFLSIIRILQRQHHCPHHLRPHLPLVFPLSTEKPSRYR